MMKRWQLIAFLLVQIASNFHVSTSVYSEIEDLKEALNQERVDRETYFLRKSDLNTLSSKMDKLTDEVVRLKEQVNSLRAFMKMNFNFDANNACFDEAFEEICELMEEKLGEDYI